MSLSRSGSTDETGEAPFTLYACGRSTEGQLGLAGRDDLQNVVDLTPVTGFKSRFPVEVVSGLQHTLMLGNDGSLFSCGNNDHGQLGRSGQSRWKPGKCDYKFMPIV